MAMIFMPLLEEGTDAWRPVEVTPLASAQYRVEGPMPDGETWQYPPGTLVQLRRRKFSDGERRFVPNGSSPTVKSTFANYLLRNVGILAGVLPLLLVMQWLPPQAGGRLGTMPVLLASLISALIAAVVLLRRKPEALVLKWASWSALGFGILFALVGMTIDV